MQLPAQLPTVSEWENTHPTPAFFPKGNVATGHEHLVLGDFFTYFGGWPYPPADRRLRLVFERCVPELGQPLDLWAQIFSPLHVQFVDSHGRKLGFDAHGHRELNIPGGILLGGHPQTFMVPSGNYTVRLKATGNGKATLVFYYPGHGAVDNTRVFTLKVRRGEKGTLRIRGSRPALTLNMGRHFYRAASGLGLGVRGLPKHLRRGHKRASTVRVVDQLGRPVIDAVVKVSGRGFHATVVTDSSGRARLTLNGRPGGLKVLVTAPGYVRAHTRIATVKR